MSRLIVVSNRMGDPRKPAKGGLAVALNGALNEIGGVWMGWSGTITDTAPGEGQLHVVEEGKITLAGLDLNQQEHDGYYLGYSNSVLWPAFHHRTDLIESDSEAQETYKRVNRTFATRLYGLLQPDDVIWVHDYHLIPLAMELRAMGVKNRIGFFLHIPMPPSQIFSAIPEADWLMRCFYHFDVLGFQTQDDAMNFRLYAERILGEDPCSGDQIKAYGRTVTSRAFPIGIDVDQFRDLLNHPDAVELSERLELNSLQRKWVTGVERLDYSKGLPERMKVFRRLLEKYPENMRRTTLVQIAPPTREAVDAYADIRNELESLSGAVNGEFARIDWTPIRYIHRHVSRAKLAALFSISKVGLVTPLRDGMNLVAKEYVAVQPDDDPGVLVLSRFAGAAEEMDAALLVNPFDIESTADTLQRALSMSLDERKERHEALKRVVEDGDVVTWCNGFLDCLRAQR
ncbi:trehalose-6-phosphate synthase [Pseudahrensia aquimaris]|uniref:Trehalose-6-phosphate synthase n=1 Tax=Pseudahrensia aquimaris TaxID=744461 RepID=A0ABW3FBH8_9HYPH